jgi:hypothetical protein
VSLADHDHRGDYAAAGHSHRDYAGVLHRHRHDEAAIERLEAALHRAQSRISRLEETIARLAGALELPAGEHEETWRSGTAGAAHAAVAGELCDADGWPYAAIRAERDRQAVLWAGPHAHGQGDCSSPLVPLMVKVAVLGEEFGEVARAALDGKAAQMRTELVQLAAVACAMLEGAG